MKPCGDMPGSWCRVGERRHANRNNPERSLRASPLPGLRTLCKQSVCRLLTAITGEKVKFPVHSGYTTWPRLPAIGTPQFAGHYLWCPLHGWLMTQQPRVRPPERLTERLTPREENNPSLQSLDPRGFLLPSSPPVFWHSPRCAQSQRHSGDDRCTPRRKAACSRRPSSLQTGLHSHLLSGFPASCTTRVLPASNWRCFSVKLGLWMITVVSYNSLTSVFFFSI